MRIRAQVVELLRRPAEEPAALAALQALRTAGLRAEMGYRGNMKRRLERANRIGAHTAIIIGADELARGVAALTYRGSARRGDHTYDALFTSTYVHEGGSWKLAVHQQTPI